jgi:hypothetical protein
MTRCRSSFLAVALVMSLLPLAAEASIDLLKLKAERSHDVVAATRGLIQRRLGARYNDQVRPSPVQTCRIIVNLSQLTAP